MSPKAEEGDNCSSAGFRLDLRFAVAIALYRGRRRKPP